MNAKKKEKDKMVTSHVHLPRDVVARIERLRKRLEKGGPATTSQAIRMAIVHGLNSLEGA